MNILTISLAVAALVFLGLYLKAVLNASAKNQEALKNELARLFAEQFEAKSDSLMNRNNAQMTALYEQIRRDTANCTEVTNAMRKESAAFTTSIKEVVGNVAERSLAFSAKADELVSALKRGNKVQGNWGEAILARLLDDAGLVKGLDYFEQEGSRDTGMPDVTITCGGKKKILVDSKVNITDFITAVNLERDGRQKEAAAMFEKHAEGVRKQIKGLGDREYPAKMHEKDPETVYSKLVIMFMPSEATYYAAIAADPELNAYAKDNNVLIASPMMLFGYLTLIRIGLDSIEMNENQQKIADYSNMIVDRMALTIEDLSGIGTALDAAKESYQSAMGRFGDGSNPKSVLAAAKKIAKYAKREGLVLNED